jgi:hypothetical protein
MPRSDPELNPTCGASRPAALDEHTEGQPAAEITHLLGTSSNSSYASSQSWTKPRAAARPSKVRNTPSQMISGAKRLVAAPMSPAFTESIQRCASSTRSGVVDSSGIRRLSPRQAGRTRS